MLGCIGADPSGQSSDRDRVTPYLYSITPDRVRDFELLGWTHYGLFRREIFCDGVRFDQTCPFDGPGWDFEDNDLAFQMKVRGYRNQYFTSMVYLISGDWRVAVVFDPFQQRFSPIMEDLSKLRFGWTFSVATGINDNGAGVCKWDPALCSCCAVVALTIRRTSGLELQKWRNIKH